MGNFEFLKTEWLDIYKLASEAEECVYSKPVYTCILCRNALESAVKWMYKNDIDLVEPYDCTLNSLVHEQSFKNVIVPPLFQKVNLIRINGNTAAHNPQRINDKDALQGIKYDELSAEEKEEYETKFYDEETETLPEEIDAAQLNKWLFNTDTVDKILECLMENGIKVNGGDKLGKTIIFAANENHAQFIAERFDANYKQYNGKFARVITHKTQYSQSLIDKFSTKEEDPVIAISVDKLDTGIDVPEIVNLVFFKVVRSRTKFHQMIGRGTRLCPELFGLKDDKKKFFIFDACGNFEYFSINPEGAKSSNQMSLGQKIFLKKLELAEKIKDDDEVLKLLSNKIKDDLHNTVKTMNRDNFIVRRHLRAVDEFSNREKWDSLDDMDFITIKDRVSHLPTTLPEEDEYAKRFDLMILNTQLSYYAHDMVKFEKYQKNIKEIAFRLEEKSSIPLVKQNLELIQSILTDEFWANVTISTLEEVRIKLRNLVNLIDYAQRDIIYSDFEDELDPIPGTVSVNTAMLIIACNIAVITLFLRARKNYLIHKWILLLHQKIKTENLF